ATACSGWSRRTAGATSRRCCFRSRRPVPRVDSSTASVETSSALGAQSTVPGDSVTGSCLCGAVRFRVTLPTLFCAHCHCSLCPRNHGAAYVTWFGIARERLALEAGADVLVRHLSSEHGSRSFCGRCGSSLFCESTRHPDHVDVVLASMLGPIDRAPAMHV